MTDIVKLDDSYAIEVSSAVVTLHRSGVALIDPQESEAWRAAFLRIQELEAKEFDQWAQQGSTMNPETFTAAATGIAEHLAEAWNWLPDEPEAVLLGKKLAEVLHLATEGTATRPEVLLSALLGRRIS